MANYKNFFYRQIIQRIQNGQIDPSYFMYGEETYLMDSLVEQITKKFLGQVEKQINYFVRYATDTPLEEMLSLMSGPGLFSQKKVVIYKDYQNLKNPNLKGLIKYLKNPDPNICFIIIARTTSINLSKYQSLKDYAKFVYLLPLRDAELNQFIRNEFEQYEKKITPEAIRALVYLVGEQIHDLKSEIIQVINYYKEETEITPEQIEQVVGVYVNQNVFELIRIIAQRNISKSLFILHNLLEKGENPGTILFFLLRHISILWKIQGCYRSGIKDKNTIQKRLKIYPKQFDEYSKELNKWNVAQLKQAFSVIEEGDRLLKSSQISPNIILDMLVLKLVNLE